MNLTPLRASKPEALALRAMLRYAQRSREQPSHASLESELSDSALLGYLRRRSRRERRCKGEANPFFSAEKEKYGTPKWVFRIFGGGCET